MKKFLLSSLLGVFLLGFGGISMAAEYHSIHQVDVTADIPEVGEKVSNVINTLGQVGETLYGIDSVNYEKKNGDNWDELNPNDEFECNENYRVVLRLQVLDKQYDAFNNESMSAEGNIKINGETGEYLEYSGFFTKIKIGLEFTLNDSENPGVDSNIITSIGITGVVYPTVGQTVQDAYNSIQQGFSYTSNGYQVYTYNDSNDYHFDFRIWDDDYNDWFPMDINDKFTANDAYRVGIRFMPMAGYSFGCSTNECNNVIIAINGANRDESRLNSDQNAGWLMAYKDFTLSAPTQTEISEITISGITDPVLGAYPVTGGITITSTPEGAVHVANSWWSDFNGYTLCNPMGICSNDRDTSYFSNQDSVPNKKYYLVINYVIDDGYELADNATITTNGNGTVTTPKTGFVQLTYNASDLQAAPAPTEISEISITGITLPVGGNIPTKEGIVSATTGITVSNRNTIGNMNYDMVRCSVDTDPELCDVDLPSFVAGTKYNLYIPFTVDDGYVLANSFTATDGTNSAIETSGDIKRVVFQYTATEPTASYNITYHLDGGTNHTDNPSTYGTLTEAITLKEPTKDGNYVFGGWYSDADFTTEVTEISVGATGDKDFYAKWIEGKEETIPTGTTAEVGTDDITTVITNENAPEISAVKSSDIATKGKTATVKGGIKISARKNGTIIFSKPFKVKFKVKGASKIRVKVRHGNSAFGFDGLVSEADGECDTTNGKASSKAYNGEELSVDSEGNVTIYTCSASTFIAYTEETPSSNTSSSSGGGGSHKTVKTEANTGDVENETKVDETKDEEKTENTTEKSEFEQAYEFAYENGITTMKTIEEADMNSPLTRIAMAKMLSQYAINVLGKKPANIVVPNFPDVDEKLDDDYNNGVTLAYQLGIMGIGIDNFRPFDLVPRAEFATALSRMLYGLEDGTDAYYSTHLAKLMEEGIITNDNPNLQETRGYVMIMLMRSAK